jgi:glycosyltransferase involved in cell wall biosynthesis
MKILFISHTFFPTVGGIEVNSEILARNFSARGHEVILTTQTKSSGTDCFSFPVVRAPSIYTKLKLLLWADIIFHNNPSLPYGILGLPKIHKTYVAVRVWISGINGQANIKSHLKRFFVRLARNRIYVSNPIALDCKYPGHIIGNPYRVEIFRKNTDFTERNSDFLFVGRLVEDKGADIFIMALKQASLTIPIRSATIVGDGADKAKLQKLAKEMLPNMQIEFTGEKGASEINSIYNQHKVLVVPSRWPEPFGNVALEGLASGCITVVSDGGGLPDAVGSCGLVFERGNSSDLARCMISALTNISLQQQLFSRYDLHLKNHHETVVADRYLAVLLETTAIS